MRVKSAAHRTRIPRRLPLPAWLPDAPWYVPVAVPLIILAAYAVFGATGLGSSIIPVPALAHFFPLTFVVPLIAALDVMATGNASRRQWRCAEFGEFPRLLPVMLTAIAAGTTLLVNRARGLALPALGVFVAGCGAHALAGRREWKARRPGFVDRGHSVCPGQLRVEKLQ